MHRWKNNAILCWNDEYVEMPSSRLIKMTPSQKTSIPPEDRLVPYMQGPHFWQRLPILPKDRWVSWTPETTETPWKPFRSVLLHLKSVQQIEIQRSPGRNRGHSHSQNSSPQLRQRLSTQSQATIVRSLESKQKPTKKISIQQR